MCNQPGTKICSHRCAKTKDIGTFWISHASSTIWCSSWQCCHTVMLVEIVLAKRWMILKKCVVSYTLHCRCKCLSSQTCVATLSLEVSTCMKIFVSAFQFLPHCNLSRVNIFFVPNTWKLVVSCGVCVFFPDVWPPTKGLVRQKQK